MIQLLIFMLVAYGMTTILVYGSIFNGLRNSIHKIGSTDGFVVIKPIFKFISELISCMLCTGTWVGFFLSLTMFSPIHDFIGLNKYYSIFFDGMFSAGSVWAINAIIEWFEENRPVKQQVYIEETDEQILND
jgi:hypothetical protein